MGFHKGSENAKLTYSVMPKTGTVGPYTYNGNGVDMAKYNNYAAIISLASASAAFAAGDFHAYIAESTDNTTYTAVTGATTTLSTSTLTPQVTTVELRAEEMSDGYRYLRCTVDGTGTQGFDVLNSRWNSRYPQATLPS